MDLKLTGEIWYWRGPSPFHFVTVPDDGCAALAEVAAEVSYGWGMIPVTCRIGDTTWTTSLWPRDGGYIVPIKDKVRAAEALDLGDTVTVHLTVAPRR